jgi:hypothetical protein
MLAANGLSNCRAGSRADTATHRCFCGVARLNVQRSGGSHDDGGKKMIFKFHVQVP